jgi:hypothetical protein
MAKTYAEKKKEKTINWSKFLKQKCEDMHENEVTQRRWDAEDWVTCACGNQCAIIPRDMDGVPKNRKLRELGVKFSGEISLIQETVSKALNSDYESDVKRYYKEANQCRKKAIKILSKIEERSAILIKKIKKNDK